MLYGLLLWASRGAFVTGEATPLSRAITFLSDDYGVATYWWEPLEMGRKLALTGWTVLINEENELARVVVALLTSLLFLAVHTSIRPFRRCAWPRGDSTWLVSPPGSRRWDDGGLTTDGVPHAAAPRTPRW